MQAFLFGFEEAINLLDQGQQLFGILFRRRLFTQLHPLLAVFQADTLFQGIIVLSHSGTETYVGLLTLSAVDCAWLDVARGAIPRVGCPSHSGWRFAAQDYYDR
jgi:hypothetical protein